MATKYFSKFLLFAVINFLSLPLLAQDWLPQKNGHEVNFYELRDAFDAYWKNKPIKKGKGYKQFKRWEHMMLPKVFPDGNFPEQGRYMKEYRKFMQTHNSGRSGNSADSLANWTPLGITSWKLGASGYNPGNGRVNCVTIDPANPEIIFTGTPNGGIWKSIDGGNSWNTTFDNQPVLGVSAIAIDPNNSSRIFIGTGDRDGYDSKSIGILKSDDGGGTWSETGLHFTTPSSNSINKIIFNPLNTSVMLAASNEGLYRSDDSGESWLLINSDGWFSDVKFNPSDTGIVYACGESFVRSDNGGNSFVKITDGLPSDAGRMEIAVTQANSFFVYLIASSGSDDGFGGLYKSFNKGLNFSEMSTSPNIMGYEQDGSDEGGQGWYDLAIAASPTDENEIYIGGINVWKSNDGGISWMNLTSWYYVSDDIYTHADIHSLSYYGNKLYCTSDGGVFVSNNEGISWQNLSSGLGISQFYAISGLESQPDMIIAGAQDNGSNLYKNGEWRHLYGADGFESATNKENTDIVYVSSQNGGFMRSDDGGENFWNISVDTLEGNWLTPFAIDPYDPYIVYAGYNELYKSGDAGYNWEKISDNNTNSNNIDELHISEADHNTIYYSINSKIYITQNGGNSWVSKSPMIGSITGITSDNTNSNKVWLCGTSNTVDKVVFSNDGGNTFSNITKNLTNVGVNTLIRVNNSKDALFVGTEVGVFYTDSTMNEWIPFNTNLPNISIQDFEINYQAKKIRAATFGRGLWESPIPDSILSTKNLILEKQISIYPNPTNGLINIDFNLNAESDIVLEVFNVVGNSIQKSAPGKLLKKNFVLNLNGYVSGVYFIKITSGTDYMVKKIVLY